MQFRACVRVTVTVATSFASLPSMVIKLKYAFDRQVPRQWQQWTNSVLDDRFRLVQQRLLDCVEKLSNSRRVPAVSQYMAECVPYP